MHGYRWTGPQSTVGRIDNQMVLPIHPSIHPIHWCCVKPISDPTAGHNTVPIIIKHPASFIRKKWLTCPVDGCNNRFLHPILWIRTDSNTRKNQKQQQQHMNEWMCVYLVGHFAWRKRIRTRTNADRVTGSRDLPRTEKAFIPIPVRPSLAICAFISIIIETIRERKKNSFLRRIWHGMAYRFYSPARMLRVSAKV